MDLPLLNDNLSGFSNTCGVILGPLEELLWLIFGKIFGWVWASGDGSEENI